MSDDEVEVDDAPVNPVLFSPQRSPAKAVRPAQPSPEQKRKKRSETTTDNDDSFVSAKEDLTNRNASRQAPPDSDNDTIPDEEMEDATAQPERSASDPPIASATYSISAQTADAMDEIMEPEKAIVEEDAAIVAEGGHTPSEGSSPVKPLVRKSSFTFASLPAREPLLKKSLGQGRSSQVGRFTGGKSLGGSQITGGDTQGDEMDVDEAVPEKSEAAKLHNKTSTQRLHERINMLGQSQSKEPRPSKSIPSQTMYPRLPSVETDKPEVVGIISQPPAKPVDLVLASTNLEDDDDDWIPVSTVPAGAASQSQSQKTHQAQATDHFNERSIFNSSGPEPVPPQRNLSPERPGSRFFHRKSPSASAIPSPARVDAPQSSHHQKAISVSNPEVNKAPEEASVSPKRNADGPLSASKSKFYSVLKSAKSIFASSAGVSAQAKMEALSPATSRIRNVSEEDSHQPAPVYPSIGEALKAASSRPQSPSKDDGGRRTRSSSEREKRLKEKESMEQQRIATDLDKAREKERQKAALQKEKATIKSVNDASSIRSGAESRAETLAVRDEDSHSAEDMPPPPPPKSMLPTGQGQKPANTRRIVKPTKEVPPKAGPAKFAVRLGSQAMRPPHQSTAQASQAMQEHAPPPPPKNDLLDSKASNNSLRTQPSNSSFKSAMSTQMGRPKALEAAARKREQEEKEAQRKAEEKRVREQKKEDQRRQEQQRKAAEQQRALDAKKAAAKQAQEAKKAEQQRQAASRPASRQGNGNDLAYALQQERSHAPALPVRGDLSAALPVSRMNEQMRPVPPINPAKPAKRPLQEIDEQPLARPGIQRNPPSYQQPEAKRRKTDEGDEENQEPRRSVMAPPIRQSNIRKVSKVVNCPSGSFLISSQEQNKFPHGYTTAPPAQHGNSMFKATLTSQHLQQQSKTPHANDMTKFATAKIPFANDSQPASVSTSQQVPLKTPGPSAPGLFPASHQKSSPHYPNGENISLPEIATDSEDEDSENEFVAPSWVNSPALRELLTQQQLVDPETVFGPIAPLQMEEIFKNKDRHKRFRDRTSSALWSNDKLTEEEKKKDREGRERVMREGGWVYHSTPEPSKRQQ